MKQSDHLIFTIIIYQRSIQIKKDLAHLLHHLSFPLHLRDNQMVHPLQLSFFLILFFRIIYYIKFNKYNNILFVKFSSGINLKISKREQYD
jgi:hypothetical protein